MKTNDKFYRFMRGTFSFLYKIIFNPKIIGTENIPAEGSLIMAANHVHLMDPCIHVVSTKRIVRYLAKRKLFSIPIVGHFFNWMHCIPVEKDTKNKKATDEAIKILKANGTIGIFPEGTRNRTEAFLLPFKFGAVSMAKKTDSYIIPCGITGKYTFRSKDLMMRYGKPFKVTNLTLEEANKKLFKEVEKLMKENLEEGK